MSNHGARRHASRITASQDETDRAPRYRVHNAHLSWPKDPTVIARLRRGDSVPAEDYGAFIHAYRGEVRDDLSPGSIDDLLAQGSIARTDDPLKVRGRAVAEIDEAGEREDPARTHAAALWAREHGSGDVLPDEAEPVAEEATDGE